MYNVVFCYCAEYVNVPVPVEVDTRRGSDFDSVHNVSGTGNRTSDTSAAAGTCHITRLTLINVVQVDDNYRYERVPIYQNPLK